MLFHCDGITLEGSSIRFATVGREGLALVQEFSVGRCDANTGMYSLIRTEKVEAISIESIERGVHLIPKFGTDLEKVDTLKWIKGLQRDTVETRRQEN